MLATACEARACRPGSEAVHSIDAGTSPRRGDRVVVEVRAAEFFEARVLSAAKGRVRVLPQGGGEPLSVAESDLYSLTETRARAAPGVFAICRHAGRWLACRQAGQDKDASAYTTLEGITMRAQPNDVLAASASTELNLRQAFKKAEKRLRFLSEASRAGSPEVPPGFRPATHARVVVRRAGGWYSATIEEVNDHDLTIVLPADGARERVTPGEIVPEPPTSRQPSRGDFVLVRPLSPSEPWQVSRVESTAEREFRVAQPDADERVVGLRDLLPLVPP
jgi:hypothetical protein